MVSLKSLHTFGLDVSARSILELREPEDFRRFLSLEEPKILLGSGSDVLFTGDFAGTVGLVRSQGLEITEDPKAWHVHAAAGENWHETVLRLEKQGIPGLENLALIPGTCGAAPVQNIGAYGCELADFCEYVEICGAGGGIRRIPRDSCGFGYRTSNFKTKWAGSLIITGIGLKLPRRWVPRLDYGPLRELKGRQDLTSRMILEEVVSVRRSKIPDPTVLGNAGSFFQNPCVPAALHGELLRRHPGMPAYPQKDGSFKLAAGWLIEHAGLSGRTLGGAQIYSRQALILVNTGSATPGDVVALAREVIHQVFDTFGVRLVPEVRILGADGEIPATDL